MKYIKINSKRGYTLIELIVVIGIFLVLAGGILISAKQIVKCQNDLEVESCKNNLLIFINKSRLYCRNKSTGGEVLFDTINNEIKFKMRKSVIDRISMYKDFKLKGTNLANGSNSISIDKYGSIYMACTIIITDKFEKSIPFTVRLGTGYLEVK